MEILNWKRKKLVERYIEGTSYCRMHVNNVYVTHKVSARVFLPVWNGDVRDVPIRVLDFSLLILLG